ncbi:MAG: DUF4881 domain-containing protein [Deltaproteobacteria bacterium]|nr:DUF4881 domain-containing protein [Deltaproteobacteria bacterium]
MIRRLSWLIIFSLLPLALVTGCGEMGKVDQGRVIAFDKAKGVVTLIQDKKAEPGAPDYNTLPPHTYTIPEDPKEMGPEPKPGLRMKLDAKAKEIVIFDPATQNFKTIPYSLIDQREGVGRSDPLVAGKTFPVIDRDKKTITEYSSRQRLLVTFSVPDEYFNLPPETWEAGDEVRIYYKEPGKALRLMNITRTDIFKK